MEQKGRFLNKSRAGRALVVLVAAVFTVQLGRAQEIPAKPPAHVVDLAGVVDDATEARLNRYLLELEQKTGAQMLVLTVKTTGGVPIRNFSIRTAEQWKLGQADKDNGALIVVAVNDRKWDIDVGYGLEPVLTDLFCGRVAREVFVPAFRRNQYSQGIWEGTLILANKVASNAGVTVTGMPVRKMSSRRPQGASSCACLAFVFFFMLLMGVLGRRRRGYRRWGGYSDGGFLPGMILGTMMGSGRRGWGGSLGGGSWGGGGFGGGYGGFGGGGGGSFGGGGASGSW